MHSNEISNFRFFGSEIELHKIIGNATLKFVTWTFLSHQELNEIICLNF